MTTVTKKSKGSHCFAVRQLLGDRANQQDSFHLSILPGNALLALVADGMGGHQQGARASSIVAEHFAEALMGATGSWPGRLRSALLAAQAALAREFHGVGDAADAGTTLAAVVICNHKMWHISVGDSVVAMLLPGTCHRINTDHSMVPLLQRQLDEGLIDQADFEAHPQRGQLRSAVTVHTPPALIDCPDAPTKIPTGASVVIMSDGMASLSPRELAAIFASAPDATSAVEQATGQIAAAAKAGQDNATLIAVCLAQPVFTGVRRFAALVSVAVLAALASWAAMDQFGGLL